jgi:hypothetical protein
VTSAFFGRASLNKKSHTKKIDICSWWIVPLECSNKLRMINYVWMRSGYVHTYVHIYAASCFTLESKWMLLMIRVTRLGDFSPLGWLFTFQSTLKSSPLITTVKGSINYDHKCAGLNFGQFLANTSGHPAIDEANDKTCTIACRCQGDQMSLRKKSPKTWPNPFLSQSILCRYAHAFTGKTEALKIVDTRLNKKQEQAFALWFSEQSL